MGWNDTFTNSTDWSAVTFVEMFYKAYNERRNLLGTASVSLPVVGTDVQSAGFWSTLQSWLQTECDQFCDASVTFPLASTATPPIADYTLATWRTAAGINSSGFTRKYPRQFAGNGKVFSINLSGGDDPTGGTWSLSIYGSTLTGLAWNIAAATLQTAIRALTPTGASTTTVGKVNFVYTITCPEIAGDLTAPTVNDSGLTNGGVQTTTITTLTNWNATATTYSDGSAFANGHRARSTSSGNVYDRTAGAWVLTSNPTGDAPDTVTAYGLMAAGDYIGPWIWNEIRDGFNVLTRICRSASTVADESNEGEWAGSTEFSWASCQATIASLFPTAATPRLGTFYDGQYFDRATDYWRGWAFATELHVEYTANNLVAATARLVLNSRNSFGVGSNADQYAFDANGSILTENTYVVAHSQSLDGGGGTTALASPAIGDANQLPNPPPDPSSVNGLGGGDYGIQHGWKAVNPYAIIDGDFDYA